MTDAEAIALHADLRLRALDKLGPKLAEVAKAEIDKVVRPIRNMETR